MTKFFSASALGFYIEDLNSDIPDDAVAVSDEMHAEFANVAWPERMILGSDNDGMPAWVDAPPLTKEEEVAAADSKKRALIDQANTYMNGRQWPGKAAIGRLTTNDLAQYNLWLDYLDALEAVDTSTAPGIEWPTPPAA